MANYIARFYYLEFFVPIVLIALLNNVKFYYEEFLIILSLPQISFIAKIDVSLI